MNNFWWSRGSFCYALLEDDDAGQIFYGGLMEAREEDSQTCISEGSQLRSQLISEVYFGPAAQGQRLDMVSGTSRPLFEPPIFTYNGILERAEEEEKDLRIKHLRNKPVARAKVDGAVECLLFRRYLEWAVEMTREANAYGDYNKSIFYRGLSEDVMFEAEAVGGDSRVVHETLHQAVLKEEADEKKRRGELGSKRVDGEKRREEITAIEGEGEEDLWFSASEDGVASWTDIASDSQLIDAFVSRVSGAKGLGEAATWTWWSVWRWIEGLG